MKQFLQLFKCLFSQKKRKIKDCEKNISLNKNFSCQEKITRNLLTTTNKLRSYTAQNMKFSIKDFFGKCGFGFVNCGFGHIHWGNP